MKPSSNLILIAGLLISCLGFVTVPVSADTFVELYEDSQGKLTTHPYLQPDTSITEQVIRFIDYPDVSVYDGLVFWGYTSRQSLFTSPIPEGDTGIARIYSTKGIIAEGYFGSDYTYNSLGGKTGGQFWINFYECNIENIIGPTASIGIYYFNGTHAGYLSGLGGIVIGAVSNSWDNGAGFGLYRSSTQSISCEVSNIVYQSEWNASIEATYNSGLISNVRYLRNGYYSSINLTDEDGISFYYDYSNSDIDYDFAHSNYNFEIINPYGRSFFESLIAEEPVEPKISVLASVKNIQDYSVIGDSTISFVSDTENITRTMPNGYDLFILAKDTWYNVSATADGYTPQLAYEPNLWTGSSAIDVWMIPTSEESNETVQMNWYVSESNSAGPGTLRLSNAVISINSKTLITDASGYASTILNRSGSISYTVKKDGYNTYSRAFTPNWQTYTPPTIDEHIQLLRIDEPVGGVTPAQTPDIRSSNQKAESAMNILFDNIEGIVQLAVVVLIISLISMIAGGGKKR